MNRNPYPWGPITQMPIETRIGDHEREAAVTDLGEHYVAGRLTKDEYDERAERAWSARTGSALAPLFADLPALHAPVGPTRRSPARGRFGGFRAFPVFLLLLLLVALTPLPGWVLLIFGALWWSGLLTGSKARCFR